MRPLLLIHSAFLATAAIAQFSVDKVIFSPSFGGRSLVIPSPQEEFPVNGVSIDAFRFYRGPVSGYTQGEKKVLNNDYLLVDAEDPATFQFTIGHELDSIEFLLGVDSLTNVSGAFGGDLDPIHGMYWTWNSGYINLKVEGRSAVSPYPKHEFELHLGGYLPPYQTAQRIVLAPVAHGNMIVRIDLLELLEDVDLSTRCNVMSPGAEAVRLSREAAEMFKVDG